VEHYHDDAIDELAAIDILSFEAYFQKSMPKKVDTANTADTTTANCHSLWCVECLIQIILGNDEFYQRLLDESQDSPNREEMDGKRFGTKIHFGPMLKRPLFITASLPIGGILVRLYNKLKF
jgi:hypothetical protein